MATRLLPVMFATFVAVAFSKHTLTAVPVAMSSVTLTGDWADKQMRNQEAI